MNVNVQQKLCTQDGYERVTCISIYDLPASRSAGPFVGRHSRSPALLPAGRGISPGETQNVGDPSLRLKNGCAQDDAGGYGYNPRP